MSSNDFLNNDEFFNAKVANQKTLESIYSSLKDDLRIVYDNINKEIANGQFKCTIDFYGKPINDRLTEFLKNKGFEIEIWTGCQKDPANDLIVYWG